MKFKNLINPAYWFNKAIDKRIQNYSKGVGNVMQYNPLLVTMTDPRNDRHLTRRVLENSVWYSGIEQDLQYFYKTQAPKFIKSNQQSESLNYFWNKADSDIRKIHSGFPQLICEKMADLLTSSGYEIKVEGKNEEELQEELDALLEDNDFKTLLIKSIETESWSGGVSWKISYNPTISEYPIIEAWEPEHYNCTVICGRVMEDIFYIYYEKNNVTYRLSEIYGVDKTKGAYIDYRLDQLVYDGNGQEEKGRYVNVSLAELEQTKDLKKIVFNGYFKKLSLYKANKLPNSEFRNTYIGESDYAGSYGMFDAVDEILSTFIQEYRDGKLYRYFPEEYLPKGTDGKATAINNFKKDHIIYKDSPSENVADQKIQYEQGDIRIEKHIEGYKMAVQNILNNAGLSPLTVGITGFESIDASAESQQEREKVSIRTSNKKVGMWTEFLQKILTIALELRLMTKNMQENAENVYNIKALPEFELLATFNDYIIKSKSDRTVEVQNGIGSGWDILTGVKYIHSDKTPREQLAISARVKLEQGLNSISQAEISALNAENMINNEELIEDGVELIETQTQEDEVAEDITEELETVSGMPHSAMIPWQP